MCLCCVECSLSEQDRNWSTFSACPTMEWISRAHRCTMVFNPVGFIRSPYVQTNCNVPFDMKRNGLRSSWIRVWLGARHPVSSGLCGLNECAVSICPSIILTKASLLSSTSTEGIREKLHQALFFFSLIPYMPYSL